MQRPTWQLSDFRLKFLNFNYLRIFLAVTVNPIFLGNFRDSTSLCVEWEIVGLLYVKWSPSGPILLYMKGIKIDIPEVNISEASESWELVWKLNIDGWPNF